MIGCSIYTDAIECTQYINDVMQMKILFIIILLILSLLTIYFTNSKKYRMLKKKYSMFNTMFMLPKWSSYLFLITLIFIPFFLSINVEREVFLNYIYAFIVPNIAWMLLILFGFGFEWIANRLGFNSSKHFMKCLLFKK